MAENLLYPGYTHQEDWSEFDTADDYQRCEALVTAPNAGSPDYGAYGLNDVPQAPDPDDSPPEDSRSTLHRLRDSIIRRQLPWRLRWLPEVPAALRHSPGEALRGLVPLTTQSLTPEGFRMRVYGREVLADLMASSAAVGVRPFLLWGTLLGCIREQRFIHNDHDIDVGLLEADFQLVPELKREMLARGYTIRRESTMQVSFMHRHGRLWVDVDRLISARGHYWITEPPSERAVIRAYWFAIPAIGTLARRRFEGVEVFIPENPEAVLTSIYGAWTVPQQKRYFTRGPLNQMLWRQGAQTRV